MLVVEHCFGLHLLRGSDVLSYPVDFEVSYITQPDFVLVGLVCSKEMGAHIVFTDRLSCGLDGLFDRRNLGVKLCEIELTLLERNRFELLLVVLDRYH